MKMMIKCVQSEGLLKPYFTVGKSYPAVIECDGTVRCSEDDRDTIKIDGLAWCFWRMPNTLVAAYQHEQYDKNTLFEVV